MYTVSLKLFLLPVLFIYLVLWGDSGFHMSYIQCVEKSKVLVMQFEILVGGRAKLVNLQSSLWSVETSDTCIIAVNVNYGLSQAGVLPVN